MLLFNNNNSEKFVISLLKLSSQKMCVNQQYEFGIP